MHILAGEGFEGFVVFSVMLRTFLQVRGFVVFSVMLRTFLQVRGLRGL